MSDESLVTDVIAALREAGVTPSYIELGGGDGINVSQLSQEGLICAILTNPDPYLIVDLPQPWKPETHPGHLPEGKTSHVCFHRYGDRLVIEYGSALSPVLDRFEKGRKSA